jgi:hypothetical protein
MGETKPRAPAALQNGAYVLREPIPNPRPDGRKRAWFTDPEIPAGRYFVSVVEDWGPEDGGDLPPAFQVWAYRDVGVHAGRFVPSLDGFIVGDRWANDTPGNLRLAALLDAAEPDPSLEGALGYARKCDYVYAADVLLRLVRSGVVSEDAVRVAIAAQKEAEAAEAEAAEAAEVTKLGGTHGG